ncbi:MAG: glycosyltransferase family protein [Romboutsia timonensis]|uniref:glycosyltransferase n=1 Tax=Romboutsia timonensis TaxID=1776391 RepID=UPI002A753E6D|nr:glycosyltransferase [Romboutsia timonensis]MDY2883010.1 glycosyltransferase family protein [Romboutsia timonensis]
MYIVFYISSHGFGHMTRCLAIIENILKNTNYNIYIACGSIQNEFARLCLQEYKNRVIYSDIVTDIGFVNKKNSLEVDIEKLESKLKQFINSWGNTCELEYNKLKNLDIKYIITDISPIGCILGKKLDRKVILISNFTWIEQYRNLNIDKNIIHEFEKSYKSVNVFIRYELCLPITNMNIEDKKDIGFICRQIDLKKVSRIKEKYGESIFITCGKSATLNTINIKNYNKTIFTTSGINIVADKGVNIVELPINIEDTQNYIAAGEMIISKAGWGTIGESLISHTPMLLIKRETAIEDTFNISKLEDKNLAISIHENDLTDLDIKKLMKRVKNKICYNELNKYKNDVENLVKILIN